MQFSPEDYLNFTLDTPTTTRPPLPIGDYFATIGEVKLETWTGKVGGKAEGKSGLKWVIPLSLNVPPDVQTQLGLNQPTITLTDSIMLDLNEAGQIDNSPGKNRGIRNYREALNLNKEGDQFSARIMQGKSIRVRVEHEVVKSKSLPTAGGEALIGQDRTVERIGGVARAF